jgi:hypothetical protein
MPIPKVILLVLIGLVWLPLSEALAASASGCGLYYLNLKKKSLD